MPSPAFARIAVIGAGVSGLAFARQAAAHGASVTLFEKSRGTGGRVSTRRFDDGATCDHGAQYFTARDPEFVRQVERWMADGAVGVWQGRIGSRKAGKLAPVSENVVRMVGLPTMNAFCRQLADGLEAIRETRIVRAERTDDQWRLFADDGGEFGPFDALVSTAPAEQTAAILGSVAVSVGFAEELGEVRYAPCLAAMIRPVEPIRFEFDGLFVDDEPSVAWIARDSSKPGRGGAGEVWIVHGSPQRSAARFDDPPSEWGRELVDCFGRIVGVEVAMDRVVTHRWKYSLPIALRPEPLWNRAYGLGVCGDAFGGPRIEGAWLSGRALASRLFST
ncbi:MAG TPA: FAD-dependent oxidoreductase [Pirellulaceae bacterium]|nr:FAD-dependent oxidoreductase [Pirellulaceae bacterium]